MTVEGRKSEFVSVSLPGYDKAEADPFFEKGSEPLPPAWAKVGVLECATGTSRDKGTPFVHLHLKVLEGRPNLFDSKGEGRHTFVDVYVTAKMAAYLAALYDAMGVARPTTGVVDSHYLLQAKGKTFLTRLSINKDRTGEYADKQQLAEFHPDTPEWRALLEEDKKKKPDEKPRSGRSKGKSSGGSAAASGPTVGGPLIR